MRSLNEQMTEALVQLDGLPKDGPLGNAVGALSQYLGDTNAMNNRSVAGSQKAFMEKVSDFDSALADSTLSNDDKAHFAEISANLKQAHGQQLNNLVAATLKKQSDYLQGNIAQRFDIKPSKKASEQIDVDEFVDTILNNGGKIYAKEKGETMRFGFVGKVFVSATRDNEGKVVLASNSAVELANAAKAAGHTTFEFTKGTPKNILASMSEMIKMGIAPKVSQEKLATFKPDEAEKHQQFMAISNAMEKVHNDASPNELSDPKKFNQKVYDSLESKADKSAFIEVLGNDHGLTLSAKPRESATIVNASTDAATQNATVTTTPNTANQTDSTAPSVATAPVAPQTIASAVSAPQVAMMASNRTAPNISAQIQTQAQTPAPAQVQTQAQTPAPAPAQVQTHAQTPAPTQPKTPSPQQVTGLTWVDKVAQTVQDLEHKVASTGSYVNPNNTRADAILNGMEILKKNPDSERVEGLKISLENIQLDAETFTALRNKIATTKDPVQKAKIHEGLNELKDLKNNAGTLGDSQTTDRLITLIKSTSPPPPEPKPSDRQSSPGIRPR